MKRQRDEDTPRAKKKAKVQTPIADIELSFKNASYERKNAGVRAKNWPSLAKIYEKEPQDPNVPSRMLYLSTVLTYKTKILKLLYPLNPSKNIVM